MNCTEFLDRLDASDGFSLDRLYLDEEQRLHAATCPGCTRASEKIQAALAVYRLPDLVSSVDLVPRVLDLIPFLPAPRRVVSMRNWLLAGFILLLSLGGLPMTGGYRALSYQYGMGFSLPLILVMSGALTLYVGLFALSHLDELATHFNLRSFSH
ncbi:MAG: hypothetical protein A3J97_02220 [Spirochaetes bacterium RIFOXYC1_FULL_54_7]|nr:MAG: hypothetical protein A3J97_02220 [Spirochaetes bacterium RIFOXYC1_FULL_54_7]